MPIILGEFGLDTNLPGALDYIDLVYRTAGEMGAGVAYWARDDGSWGPYDENKQPRNLVAALDRAYLRSTSGTPVSWSSQSDLLEFAVVVDGSSATAEAYLPARGFRSAPVAKGATIAKGDAESCTASLTITGSGKHDIRVSPK